MKKGGRNSRIKLWVKRVPKRLSRGSRGEQSITGLTICRLMLLPNPVGVSVSCLIDTLVMNFLTIDSVAAAPLNYII